ncbi:Eukaryotic rRNA processing [Cynara cardunculus var. scolymus]|uniref:Eukaryotic rRNA processing n=2 Tax=Cynara cardunculus var. scolymus TaxID=59895 RepID=A0A103Y8Q9_CYNCS|nr:Eukaryotic rRNA processing [Cynara cardunculus var. scolymus]
MDRWCGSSVNHGEVLTCSLTSLGLDSESILKKKLLLLTMAIKKRTPKLLEETLPEDEIEDLDMEASESDPETDSESESEGDEDVRLTEPSKTSIYNKDGILDKLGDISWPEDVEWIHKLSLDINQEQEVDVNDDLNRELAFYTQALEGTRQAFVKFQTMGLPFLRPSDYYAEMVKTDSHMEKIKGRLLVEKRRIEEAEERRKARDNKKKAKEVQAQKQKERVKQKKDEIESVKKWRKQRQQSGFAGGEKEGGDMGLPFADGKESQRSSTKNKRPGVSPWDRSGGKAKAGAGKDRKGGAGKRKSREFKDSKYGFGGKKGMKKQNTAETTNDFKGFNKSDSFQNKKRKK